MKKISLIQFGVAFLIIITLLLSFSYISGCAHNPDNPMELTPTGELIVDETVDAIGYTLGLLAAEDPALKADIEAYYNQIKAGNLTLVVLNELLQQYSQKNLAYKLLVYKVSGLVQRMGGEVLPDGTIESLGEITSKHLEIGKNAYLLAISTSEG